MKSEVLVLDAAGKAMAMPFEATEAVAGHRQGFVWIHLDGREQSAQQWIRRDGDLPEMVRNALLAHETRPRVAPIGPGVLVNLRGLGETPEDDPDPLVSIRIWAEKGRVISLDINNLAAVRPVREQMLAGRVRDPGDLVAAIADHITEGLDPDVARMGDGLDECETALDRYGTRPDRGRISQIRSRAISFRRFVAPQRDALLKLSALEVDWLEDADRLHLRESADRFARMTEELEAMRERAGLIHEYMVEIRSEQLEQRSYLVSIVALIFLPLTFVTGLFGMNVALPWANEPAAFAWLLWLCGGLAIGVVALFYVLRWLRR